MKVRAAPHAALALNKNLNEKAREHKRQKHFQEHNETPTEARLAGAWTTEGLKSESAS